MFSLNHPERLASIGLRDELEQMTASAQARWFAEHDGDGGHTAISAATLTLTDSAGNPYTLYVSSGKLYIVAGTTASGGTVVGTQT